MTEWSTTKGQRRRLKGKLNTQQKAANTKAKYGKQGKPAPVTVRSLDTGEVVAVKDQASFGGQPFKPKRRWKRGV